MKNIIKYLLIACFLFLCNHGFAQCYCDDIKIIELKDTTILSQAYFTFKLTADSSICSSGYSDFWFVDQVGDTINEWTGSGLWLPNPLDPIFDTIGYIIQLKPGYSSFPTSFSGNLQILNPACTIPLTYANLTTNERMDVEPDIQLFPNPTSDAIEVLNTSGIVITALEIYDANGRLVTLENKSTGFVRLDPLIPGIYFVKLYSNESVIAVKKMIKK